MADKQESNSWSNIINITQTGPSSKGFSLLRWLTWAAWIIAVFGLMKLLSVAF